MTRVALSLLLLATLSFSADPKRKPPKPPEVQVTELTVQRTERGIAFDGKVRNGMERPLAGLVLVLHLRAPDGRVVSSKRGPLDTAVLEPGEEAEFHMEVPDVARAVELQVDAFDGKQRELTVGKPGPYPIE